MTTPTKPPVIIVASLGKAGTTIVMHMLRLAGIDVYPNAAEGGDPVWLEGALSREGHPITAKLTESLRGRAFKSVGKRVIKTTVTARVVWLTRDYRQQARSFRTHAMRTAPPGAKFKPIGSIARTMLAHETYMRRCIDRAPGIDVLYMTYEHLRTNPEEACATLASHFHIPALAFLHTIIDKAKTPEELHHAPSSLGKREQVISRFTVEAASAALASVT